MSLPDDTNDALSGNDNAAPQSLDAVASAGSDIEANDPAADPEQLSGSAAALASNNGAPGSNDDVEPAPVFRPGEMGKRLNFGMPLAIIKVRAFLDACMTSNPRVRYGLGAKAPFHGAEPGTDFQRIDCSGFVREAIRLATDPMVKFPDGSVVQQDWVRDRGYRPCTIDDGTKKDDKVRIAFLSPGATSSGIGHVVLLWKGMTLESHGGTGPDTRPWNGAAWQGKCKLYELT
jgi:hypothetical protein